MGKAHGYFLRNILCCPTKPKSCHRGVELQQALALSANDLWGPVQGNLVKSPYLVMTGNFCDVSYRSATPSCEVNLPGIF